MKENKMVARRDLTRRGVASFYVVAFSTLILLIIVVSFASLVVSQLERSSNADLSQSAYDAALAGIEDAKLAYANYKYCINGASDVECSYVLEAVKNPNCGMVAVMLGRISPEEDYDGTDIKGSSGNDLQQAYTCVKIEVNPSEQVRQVQPFEPTVFKPQLSGPEINSIKSIRVKWGSDTEKPEAISVAIVQTSNSAESGIEDFMKVAEGETNRGMVYLEPNCDSGVCVELETNTISERDIVKSNDKTIENKPFHINCEENDSSYCQAIIEIPGPYGGDGGRSSFEVVVSKPKGKSESVAVMYCTDSSNCSEASAVEISDQFVVDSTGRANDMFRRVKATISVDEFVGVMGPLEVNNGSKL